MKLLLDQNSSRRLIGILAVDFPDTEHVLQIGMEKKEDTEIWDYAAANDYVIVSKDKDFYQRSVTIGHPPKVIHLHIGNCSVQEIAKILLSKRGHIRDFLAHETKSYLILP